MDKCMYEPLHGSYPKCNGTCKRGPDKYCDYYLVDEIWHTICDWKKEAKVDTPVLYKFDRQRNKLCIYTNRPGYFIGFHGSLVQKYTALLKDVAKTNQYIQNGIDFIECNDYIS